MVETMTLTLTSELCIQWCSEPYRRGVAGADGRVAKQRHGSAPMIEQHSVEGGTEPSRKALVVRAGGRRHLWRIGRRRFLRRKRILQRHLCR